MDLDGQFLSIGILCWLEPWILNHADHCIKWPSVFFNGFLREIFNKLLVRPHLLCFWGFFLHVCVPSIHFLLLV